MMGYGYENAAGDRISALIDMINGGGPGRSGGTFEGGGILSLLANAVAKPYGSVRERPGHTPMGAAAPTSMDVLRPEPVETDVPPGSDTDVYVDTLRSRVEGAINRAGATGGRTFREEDFAVLGRVHPEVAKLFSGVRVGDPLSRQQAMFLDAASIDSFAGPVLSFGDTTEEFRNPSFDLTAEEFTENLASAPPSDAASQLAPPVSPRPAAEPAAGSAGTDAPTRVTDEYGKTYYIFPGGKMIYGEGHIFNSPGDEIRPGSATHNRVTALHAAR